MTSYIESLAWIFIGVLVEVLLSWSTFVAVPQTKRSFSRGRDLPNAVLIVGEATQTAARSD